MRARLVVTDLDATLVDAHERIADSAVRAIAEMQAAGVGLLVATGRRFASAERVLAAHGLAPPAVLLAGAVGADLATGVEWHRSPLSAEAGDAVLAAFRRHGHEPVVYVGEPGLDAVAGPSCSSNPAHLAQFDGLLMQEDPQVVVAAGRCIGMGVCGVADPALAKVAAELPGVAEGWLGPDLGYGGQTLMVSPLGVTKVMGIQTWCTPRGIDAEEIIAIGDGTNDVDMLAWAGTAVAVAGGATAGRDHTLLLDGPHEWARILDLL